MIGIPASTIVCCYYPFPSKAVNQKTFFEGPGLRERG
jgi:hypothetical protein